MENAKQQDLQDKEHPVKVYYPFGGIHYLLQWWTHDDQNQIILAKSEKSFNVIVNRILADNFQWMKIVKFLKIEIVAPPQKLINLAIEDEKQGIFNDFFNDVRWKLEAYTRDNFERKLPKYFIKCNNYNSDTGNFWPDIEELKNHYNCANCQGGPILNNLSKEEFYNIYGKKYFALFPIKEYINPKIPKLVYSIGNQAKDDEDLWIAETDFGHHSDGIQLTKIDWNEINEGYLYNYRNNLFYFRLLEDLDLSVYKDKLKKLRENFNLGIKESKIISENNKKIKEEKEFQQLISIFE